MKKLTIFLSSAALLFSIAASSQSSDKYISSKSHIKFFSTTPVEDIEANNYASVSTINPKTGDVVFSVPMQSFEFEKAMMQKHFNNEHFLETNIYPKSKLKGKITNLDEIDFSKEGKYSANFEGEITIKINDLMKKYDAVLSLGNGIRAGAIHDSHDRAQMAEMIINCELAEIGRAAGCQMMVEGPGHVPLDEIEGNIMLEKRMSGNAPYYVLGPIPCDTGAGYDHISAAIGAASSARFGADLVCYITPAEHLALPDVNDVREGVRATRLAARIGDISKYPDRRENERQAAMARRDMRWDDLERYLLFPKVARQIREERAPKQKETCTMCGDFCAMKKGMEIFEQDITDKR